MQQRGAGSPPGQEATLLYRAQLCQCPASPRHSALGSASQRLLLPSQVVSLKHEAQKSLQNEVSLLQNVCRSWLLAARCATAFQLFKGPIGGTSHFVNTELGEGKSKKSAKINFNYSPAHGTL